MERLRKERPTKEGLGRERPTKEELRRESPTKERLRRKGPRGERPRSPLRRTKSHKRTSLPRLQEMRNIREGAKTQRISPQKRSQSKQQKG